MNRKITRRVVLGTAIGGLSAESLFIFRTLISDMPEGESLKAWRTAWKDCVRGVTPKIDSMETPGSFEFGLCPDGGSKGRYTILMPFYERSSFDSDTVPDRFMKKEGVFSVHKNSHIIISGNDTDSSAVSPQRRLKNIQAQSWCFLAENGVFTPAAVQKDDGSIVKIDVTKKTEVLLGALNHYLALGVDSPLQTMCKGYTWEVCIPYLGGMFFGTVKRTVDGWYRVNGVPSVKITTRQNIPFAETVRIFRQVLVNVSDSAVQKNLESQIDEIQRGRLSSNVCDESYFALSTGLLSHRYCERKVFRGETLFDAEVLYAQVDSFGL
jgi:hypothetical protein